MNAFAGGCGRALPRAKIVEGYASSTSCSNRFVRWRKLGVGEKIFRAGSEASDSDLHMLDASTKGGISIPASRGGSLAEEVDDARPDAWALARRIDNRNPRAGQMRV